jgi:hypothetical protein
MYLSSEALKGVAVFISICALVNKQQGETKKVASFESNFCNSGK